MSSAPSSITMKIANHLYFSWESISTKLAWTCYRTGMSLLSTLECNQLSNADGYITVEMIVSLHDNALSHGRMWRHVALNDYISFKCVMKRNLVSDATSERVVILTANQVINFVRSFNNIPSGFKNRRRSFAVESLRLTTWDCRKLLCNSQSVNNSSRRRLCQDQKFVFMTTEKNQSQYLLRTQLLERLL